MNQIAIPIGEFLRDVGISRVADSNEEWMEEALQALERFARQPGWETFALEDFRASYRVLPRSHNAWGALARIAVGRGILKFTGRYRNAVSPGTHAHPVKLWSAA